MNKPAGSFLLVFLVVAALFALSVFRPEQYLYKSSIRRVDLLSDILPDKKPKPLPVAPVVKTDTVLLASAVAPEVTETGISEFSIDSVGGLSRFFNSLKQANTSKKKIRIAYFGDSVIEGDLITQDLRSLLQRTFGGKGVGFVPVASNVASFRRSIRHFFSPTWKSYSYLDTARNSTMPGISGYCFKTAALPEDSTGTWVRFEGSGLSDKLSRFYKVRLFYGKGGEGNFIHYQNNEGKQKLALNGADLINEVVLNQGEPLQNLSVSFTMKDPVTIYGLSFESEDGIIIDNYAFRGNSGMPLTKIPSSVYRKFDEHFNYDLVILHYGLNVVSSSVTDFSWYERGMTNVVAHLKSSFQNSSFLLVSVSDKSYNNNGTFETDPSVPLLVEAQRKVAEKEGIAFWNLYSAMGGYNSMVSWVNADTALANKDFTHFNFRGARKVGTLLYEDLMAKYQEYTRMHP